VRVLITSAASDLPQELAAALSNNHEIRLTDKQDISSDLEFVRSDLGHGPETNDLVRGVDAIIHYGGVDPSDSASSQLDFQMRCTYNLLWAASEESVPRFIYLSSLTLMGGYDEDLAVTERWKPLPTTDTQVLCYHLGEFVCREFSREAKIQVVFLRLGKITRDHSETISSSALYTDDAVQAVDKALSAELSGWLDIFHIQSAVPNQRYLSGQPWWTADELPSLDLGYRPRKRS